MKRTTDYIAATRAYMDSPRGRLAWLNNQTLLSMPDSANVYAAIMSATHLRRYEAIQAVYDALSYRHSRTA